MGQIHQISPDAPLVVPTNDDFGGDAPNGAASAYPFGRALFYAGLSAKLG